MVDFEVQQRRIDEFMINQFMMINQFIKHMQVLTCTIKEVGELVQVL